MASSVIYEPKGRAREYAPLAVNLYEGCPHGCTYCYAPGVLHKCKNGFHRHFGPREDILLRLEKDCQRVPGHGQHVLMCFSCDPFPIGLQDDLRVTREAIKLLSMAGYVPVLLTKGGSVAAADLELIGSLGGWFGQTMMSDHDQHYQEFEPNAADYGNRIGMFMMAQNHGVNSWISVEPVVNAESALRLIDMLCGSHMKPLHWKLGKLNGRTAEHRKIEKAIGWKKYRKTAIEILEAHGFGRTNVEGGFEPMTYYIKADLESA